MCLLCELPMMTSMRLPYAQHFADPSERLWFATTPIIIHHMALLRFHSPLLPAPQDDVAIIWLTNSSLAATAAAALQANAAAIGAQRIISGNNLVRTTLVC